ncbi:MAG: GNAT family protein, partial [bacterium]
NRSVGVGAWIAASHEGQGLMYRAVGHVIGFAIDEMDMNRIEAQAGVGNQRSVALLERLGFQYEGREREGSWEYDHFVDRLCFGLLAREWNGGLAGSL